MNKSPSNSSADTARKIQKLIQDLCETERQLHQLTGGQLDAVTVDGGRQYLLRGAQEKLRDRESANRLLAETQMAILNALPAHIALVNSKGIIISVNEAWRRFASSNSFQGPEFGVGENYIQLCEQAAGDGSYEAKLAAAGIKKVIQGEAQHYSLEYTCDAPDEKRWYRLIVSPLHEGIPGGAVVMHLNITDQKLAERRLARINRLYIVLSRVNDGIVRIKNHRDLFKMVCHVAVEQGLFRLAAVLTLDEKTGNVTVATHAGAEDGFFKKISVNIFDPVLNQGTVGTALLKKTFDVCNDMLNDPRIAPWKDSCAIHGFRSSASFPIRIGETMAVLSLIAGEPNYFQEDEIQLLVAVQENLSFAMDSLHQEEQRKRAEMALREQAAWLDNAQRMGRMGSWSFHPRTGQLAWSEATCRLFGLEPGEFRGTIEHFKSFILPEDLPALESAVAGLCPARPFLELEYRVRRPDGQVRWMYDRGSLVFDEKGAPAGRIGMVMDITEQRQAREQREKDVALFRIAGKVARLGGWSLELPGRKLTWSDETCLIHDAPPGYLPTFEEGLSMFPPEHREEVMAYVDTCAREGASYDFEVPKWTMKGRLIWVRSIGEAVRDGTGKIIRLQGAFQDITERKQAELKLANLNRALRMLSACSDVLMHADDELRLLRDVCRLVVEMGGYRMGWVGYAKTDGSYGIEPMAHAGWEEGYLSIAPLSWSDQKPTGRGPAGQTIRTGTLTICSDLSAETAPIHWRKEAASRGYKTIICLPLRDGNQTFGLLGLYSSEIKQFENDELKLLQELSDNLAFGIISLRDRAERRKARHEIAQKAALLDLATDAITVRDLQHRVEFWNQGAERIYGWPAAEALGRLSSELFWIDQLVFEDAMRAVLKKGEWTGELQKKNRAGQLLLMDCRWTLMRNDQGQPVSVLCIETDITDKKKLENQFLRSQRMESLGTLASGIAHDLNNVLAPIMVSVQVLRQRAGDPDTIKMLDTLEKCSKRGADLIKQVLVFGRGIEGQRMNVNLVRLVLDLQQVIREVFPKDIEFDFSQQGRVWDVIGDPTQLHQVFMNLCVNARDAMPHGGKLTLCAENAAFTEADALANPDIKAGDFILIRVTDSGVGIPKEIRDRIFEPFFTTKGAGKGTGLGLSTALGIVKSHGGFINVYSEPAHGTQFDVYLPASSGNVLPIAITDDTGMPRGHGELILVVDDEMNVRNLTQTTLEHFGYLTIAAANGAEAVSLYKERPGQIAVVLTDMSMPVMDGMGLIAALKAMNPSIRIVASSGLGSHGRVAQIVSAGIRHFIPKPYTADTLLKTVQRALQN